MFWFPKKSFLNFCIYILVGKNVATLVNGQRNTGCYTTRWDGTNDSGEKLPTGIYFAKLSAKVEGKTYTKTEKLCLMR